MIIINAINSISFIKNNFITNNNKFIMIKSNISFIKLFYITTKYKIMINNKYTSNISSANNTVITKKSYCVNNSSTTNIKLISYCIIIKINNITIPFKIINNIKQSFKLSTSSIFNQTNKNITNIIISYFIITFVSISNTFANIVIINIKRSRSNFTNNIINSIKTRFYKTCIISIFMNIAIIYIKIYFTKNFPDNSSFTL